MTMFLSFMKNWYWIKFPLQTLHPVRIQMPFLSKAELWMHYNQILAQHWHFSVPQWHCSTPTIPHIGKQACSGQHLCIQNQQNCQISAEMHLFKPLLLFSPSAHITRVHYHALLDRMVKCMGNLGFFCCLFKPLFLLVCLWTFGMLCYSAHQATFNKNNKICSHTNSSTVIKKKVHPFFPVINASIWCSFKLPVRTIEWKGDLWFPSPVSPYIILWRWVLSPLLCHGWASISVPNDCTRAILQQSPGINLSWKRLAMNPDCLKTCVADRFHDQPSQLAVWFIPERHISSELERL